MSLREMQPELRLTIQRKGGETVSRDRAFMSRIGRKGGLKAAGLPGWMSLIGKRGAAKRLSKKAEGDRG